MNSELVSLITPTYNRSHYLRDLYQSILDQDYSDWEWIVVDDASTDKTSDLVNKWEDNRIKYIKLRKNKGTSFAKNRGIKDSKGYYICPIDSDDMLTKSSLSIRVNLLKKNNKTLWVHGRAMELIEEDQRQVPNVNMHSRWMQQMSQPKNIRYQWSIYCWCVHANTVMMKRDFFTRIGLYDEELLRCEDKELWMRALGLGHIPVYTEDFVCLYRMHSWQLTKTKRKDQDKYRQMSFDRASCRIKNGLQSVETAFIG